MKELKTRLLPDGTPLGQERAVTGDEPLMTVGAGAGTGKTWVLSTRFARLLFSSPPCLPQEILTLTFTEAAAREMQDRIRSRAFDLIAELPKEEQHAWQTVKEGFDETWISTIHSFAARLIKESGLSLDIDPRSSVVSAPQEEAFWGSFERALEILDLSAPVARLGNALLSHTAALLERDEHLLAALERWTPGALCDLARAVVELHSSQGLDFQVLLCWADDANNPDDSRMKASAEAIRDLLLPRWGKAWELWQPILAQLRPLIFEARDIALKKTDAKRVSFTIPMAELAEKWTLDQNLPDPDEETRRLFYLDLCEKLGGDNSAISKAINAELGQTATSWRNDQKKWKALSESLGDFSSPELALERELRAVLLRLCAFAWGMWDEGKRRQGLLSFSDMIRYAALSIRNDERAKGFKHVLVDEFQDTDPLQDAMIQALREKEGAKLFIVGDPKQSIYRFRHADLTLFADYMLQSRDAGAQVSLDVSFRTRDALLRPLNSLFSHIWEDGLGSGERMSSLRFEPLSAAPSAPPERETASVPAFEILLNAYGGRRKTDARKALAERLAYTFKGYREEGRTVWDKKERLLRPLRWSDCAVLTPTRSEYTLLEEAFEAASIPAVFEKSMSYFTRGEVTDVINTLRAAAFPRDETALAGWLASPFSGAPQPQSAECLKAYASTRRSGNATLYDVMREHLPETTERLRYLRNLGCLQGPSALLAHLLKDRTWLALFPSTQRLRIIANVNRAVAVAAQYENGVASSLTGCAQWLDTALRNQKEIEEPQWFEEGQDAVHVTTIHASKGLEYPVVALMRTERTIGRGYPTALIPSKTMGVALSDIPDMMRASTDDGAETPKPPEPRSLKWERALSAQGDLEESTRLFYVAATRAQDSLLLCGLVSVSEKGEKKIPENSWLSWTLSWLAKERGCDWQDLEGPPLRISEEEQEHENILPVSSQAPCVEVAAPTQEDRPLGLPEHENVALSTLSATSFALFEWCPFAWRRRHRQGLDLRWEVPDEGSPGGAELGSLAHWILARWDFQPESLASWLEAPESRRKLPPLLRDAWKSGKNKEALRSWLDAFARSPEGVSIAGLSPERLEREGAFCVKLGETRLVGATDILWQDNTEPGNWHVRDYKITLSEHAPAELYRAQLAFYALVVKLLAEKQGLPFQEVDVGLVFLREKGELGDFRRFGPNDDWQALRAAVLEATRNAAQGPWIPKREHCHLCPWAKGCPKARVR